MCTLTVRLVRASWEHLRLHFFPPMELSAGANLRLPKVSSTLEVAGEGYVKRCSPMPSTSIRKTEYDPDKRVLSVWFVASGKRYEFEGVPPEIFAEFRSAFAKGRYFNEHIRNRFRYRLADNNSG
ncbi:KTSC domain-containing protein [Mesorhizobium sp. M7D.F.Ca.US.004.03.1.1]|uniref:KTSC domain-containing protein n=1 Tax=unclassified Mesorhizobium TaxID=325217 RepID=UPI0026AF86FE